MEPLKQVLKQTKNIHERDLEQGYGKVYLPYALARKHPSASSQFAWQYVFPSSNLSREPRDGEVCRHPIHESSIQRKINLRSGMQVSTNMQAAIPLGTALRRGYLKTAMTFVRFKLYWGMLMSRQRRSILMG